MYSGSKAVVQKIVVAISNWFYVISDEKHVKHFQESQNVKKYIKKSKKTNKKLVILERSA